MTRSARSPLRATRALVAACLLMSPCAALAAPVLRSADIHITIASHTACEVRMAVTIDGASEIDHRVEMFESPSPQRAVGGEGAGIELVSTEGSSPSPSRRRSGGNRRWGQPRVAPRRRRPNRTEC